MQKIPQDSSASNGNTESIEFRPLQGGTGIYDEVDEVQGRAGSYRKVNDRGYTPVATGPAPVATFTAPSGDTYAVVNKKRKPPAPAEEVHGAYNYKCCDRLTCIVQELCESRGGRPGLSVLTSLLVSVDVKLY